MSHEDSKACTGCGCVCPCECTDCTSCSCGSKLHSGEHDEHDGND